MSKRSRGDDHEESSNDSKRIKTDSSSSGNPKFGLSDVLSVEHAVGLVQTGLKNLLDNSPTEEELDSLKQEPDLAKIPEVVLGLNRSKLLLASKLKTLYKEGKLEIFDNIINFEDALVIDQKQVQVAIIPQNNDKKSTSRSSTLSNSIPLIPQIKNNAIRSQVFMHKSVIKQKLFLSEADAMASHNERLEFIGDSFLNTIMTQIIVNEFPSATEGELSLIRTKLVNNNVLQQWSQLYGLDKKLKMNVDESVFKGKLKIYADVFEAYIGGLILESPSNYSVVLEWLQALAQPILIGFRNKKIGNKTSSSTPSNSGSNSNNCSGKISSSNGTCSADSTLFTTAENVSVESIPLNPNAKVDLYSLIGYAKLGLRYENMGHVATGVDNITIFTVQVKTKDGDILGEGKGKNVKEAGARAAMAALANKPLIEKYSLLRASIPREVSIKPADIDKSNQKIQKQDNKDISCKPVINSEDHKSKLTSGGQGVQEALSEVLKKMTRDASSSSSSSSSQDILSNQQQQQEQTLSSNDDHKNFKTHNRSRNHIGKNKNTRSNGFSRPKNEYNDRF